MTHYITIEQAVEAVASCPLCLVSGGCELSGGMAGPVDILASSAEVKKRLIAALRALQPAEATEEEVDKMAEAACDYGGDASAVTPWWRDCGEEDRAYWRGVVRAVVAVMRERE